MERRGMTEAVPVITDADAIDDSAWFSAHPERRFHFRDGWLVRKHRDTFLRIPTRASPPPDNDAAIAPLWYAVARPSWTPEQVRKAATKALKKPASRHDIGERRAHVVVPTTKPLSPYEAYLRSPQWKQRSQTALVRAGWKCQRCGLSEGLEAHHLPYQRLGHEADGDLLVVCRDCHPKEDQLHARRTEARVWSARLDGWASEKYGEDWEFRRDLNEVEEAFGEWLERRDDMW
jgi:hypothetical protein